MNFGNVVEAMRKDSSLRFRRLGWNGKGMFIQLQYPDEKSKMSLPYLYLRTADNHLVPWTPSHSDILSDDWQISETE
jgi:hypothetical protein